jgi:hypothetical protein
MTGGNMSKDKLVKIGEKVNDAIEAVWELKLNIKEIEKLEEYIAEQETILPLTDPTLMREDGFKLLNQAKERIELLKPIIELKQKEET